MDLDQSIVDVHTQLYVSSCIPMSVEFLLKLLKRVPVDFFNLQVEWQRSPYPDFSFFDGKTICNLRFHWLFKPENRGDSFPLQELFTTIERELSSDRFVLISLAVPGGWHNYVVYEKSQNGEFYAVTKFCCGQTEYIKNVKDRVFQMKGTDILIYEDMEGAA